MVEVGGVPPPDELFGDIVVESCVLESWGFLHCAANYLIFKKKSAINYKAKSTLFNLPVGNKEIFLVPDFTVNQCDSCKNNDGSNFLKPKYPLRILK